MSRGAPNTIPEAGSKLGCKKSKTYDLIKTGRLRAYKLDAKTIIFDDAIEEFQASLPSVTQPSAAAEQKTASAGCSPPASETAGLSNDQAPSRRSHRPLRRKRRDRPPA